MEDYLRDIRHVIRLIGVVLMSSLQEGNMN